MFPYRGDDVHIIPATHPYIPETLAHNPIFNKLCVNVWDQLLPFYPVHEWPEYAVHGGPESLQKPVRKRATQAFVGKPEINAISDRNVRKNIGVTHFS